MNIKRKEAHNMKKIILIISLLTIFIILSGCDQTGTVGKAGGALIEQGTLCADTDTGIDYNTAGIVSYSYKEYYDRCYRQDRRQYLREYYCKNNAANKKKLICPEACQYGKCIPQEEFIKGNSDSDKGIEPNIFGYISISTKQGQKEYYDYCITYKGKEYVYEWYLDEKNIRKTPIECQNGCQDGACIEKTACTKETPICIDSDGGINYYTSGNIIYPDSPYNIDDSCNINDITLREVYCTQTPLTITDLKNGLVPLSDTWSMGGIFSQGSTYNFFGTEISISDILIDIILGIP